MQEGNNYLKRGEGKNNGDILRRDFFNYYKDRVENPLAIKEYSKFLSAALETFSTEIVQDNMILELRPVGVFRIRTHKHYLFDEEGNKKQCNKVNWKATWNFWHTKYPNLTRDEILNLKEKKKVIYHDNEHSNGEVAKHHWLRRQFKNAEVYEFEPTREFSRMLASIMKDPERKTYYYG